MRRVAVLPVLVILVAALATRGLLAQAKPSPSPSARTMLPLCRTGCGGGGSGPSEVMVTPYGTVDTMNVSNPPANATVTFTVKNIGTQYTDTYTLSMSCTGSETCVSESQGSATLAHGASVQVTVTFTPGVNGTTGAVQLTADDGQGWSDQGWYNVVSAAPAGPVAPIVALRNLNSDNQDRGLCLTVGAGQAAGLSCGDLFVTHSLPSYETMGRGRSLGMFYSSASAAPRPAVAVSVTQPAGTPNTVYAELKVNGAVRASGTYSGFAAGVSRQIVLAYDAKDDPSGIYAFSLLVRNQFSGGSHDTTLSGSLIVANRSGSEFGAGWWLDGIEQLVTGQSGDRILWLGGDGSAAVYNNVGTNIWLRAAGSFRDTLVYNTGSGTYARTLEHGVQVVFSSDGRHLRTINRTGQVTTMTWGAPPGYTAITRLLSVSVPPAGVSDNTYTLAYEGANQFIDWIQDPAGRRIDPYVSTYLYGSKYSPTYITDADGNTVNFSYDGVGRMTGRQSRRGYWTRYTYTGALHVDSTKVPLSAAASDTAITTFRWWDEQGLSFNIAGGTSPVPPDASTVSTQVFGPRRGVADDETFVVDRFGQPLRITDPLGNVTTIVRGDASNPALPTQMTYADGRIVKMTWNARAHLVEMRDSTSHLGAAGLPTAVSRWTYSSANTKDSPDSVIDPEGVVASYAYNTWGLVSEAIGSNGHHTSAEYIASGALAGLLNAVTERQATVYDSIANSRVVSDLRTSFGFNTLGNVMSDTTPAGRVTTRSRDAYQRVYEVYDPANIKSSITYDVLNRMLTSGRYIESGVSLITRSHYSIDVLDSIIDPRGVVRTYGYDFADRRVTEGDDYGRFDQTWYNAAGQADSTLSRFNRYTAAYAGQKVRNYYDAAGRLQRSAWPARSMSLADSSTFTYDSVGRMLTAERHTTPAWHTARAYFANGAVRTELQSGNQDVNMAYSYDRAGRRTWYRVGVTGDASHSDSIWYRYDVWSGALATIGVRWRGTAQVKDSVTFTWDELGRRSRLRYGNGMIANLEYDRDGALRMVCSTGAGSASDNVFSFTVFNQWIDARGLTRHATNWRRDGWTNECGQNSTLQNVTDNTYDMRGQLLTQSSGGVNMSYQYDWSGNMTRSTQAGGEDKVMLMANGHNRLDQWTYGGDLQTGRTFQYDSSGNRFQEIPKCPFDCSSYFGRRTLWYDGLGRSTGTSEYACTDNSCTTAQWVNNYTACSYDALGRLIYACENLPSQLAYDGQNVVRTWGDTYDLGFTFVHGPGSDDPLMAFNPGFGLRWYYVTDGQGRQYAVGDVNGYDQATTNYYTDSNKGGKYAGGSQNAASFGITRNGNLQMYHVSFFRNRFYDQATGRWTQEDPVGVAGGINLYGYVGNNPATFTDPFGLCPECLLGAAVEAGGVAIVTGLVTASFDALRRTVSDGSQSSSAGRLVPTAGPRPTAGEDRQVQQEGKDHGCMTCGATTSGTESGRWIRNHVPPTSVRMPGEQQYLGPHCLTCSNRQGGWLRQQIQKLKDALKPGDSGPGSQTPTIAMLKREKTNALEINRCLLTG